MKRLRVLISAYACEPNRGSEPEVGWRVATEMARKCHIRAITRANNRKVIEAALYDIDGPKPTFLYYDLPSLFLWLKRKRLVGTSVYYVLWQIAIRWRFRKELKRVDLVHHVTFNGVQFPGFWIGTEKPVILGPLGGGMTCPEAMLPLFGSAAGKESLRSRLIGLLRFLPWWRLAIAQAKVVIAANRETANLLQPYRKDSVPVMLETAVLPGQIQTSDSQHESGETMRVLWLGHLIPRKAPILAIRSFAKALESEPSMELTIAGGGPEEPRLHLEVKRLGIAGQVHFTGKIPKAEVNALMDSAEAFLFTSIRDTSGNVVLEAMARSLPVVALRHQGIYEICDPESSLLVEPAGIEETVNGLADALIRLKREAGLAARLAEAARDRLATFLIWPSYVKNMLRTYESIQTISSPHHNLNHNPEA